MKNTTIIFAFIILSTISISGCNAQNASQNRSTISVSGVGSVMVQPDLVRINVLLSNLSPTTQQARDAVNKSVQQVLLILTEANIEAKNIITTSLRFSTEYDYSQNKRVIAGQRAEQQISFAVENIAEDQAKHVSAIIDKLTVVSGIELNQMNFDVKDKTTHFVKSRELAYQKALDKAKQYATLSGQKIVKALNIVEGDPISISPMLRLSNVMKTEAMMGAASDMTGTILPTGELEITSTISVMFLME